MKLLTPYPVAGLTLPNRIVLPAMVTRLSGEDGVVNDAVRDRYVRFAKGGAGLIVVEAMSVHGGKSGPLLRMSGDEFIPGHREMLRAMRGAGEPRIAAQIIHFLKIARSGWRQKIGDLTKDEIRAIVAQYGAAARRVREAGYDAVELHMAHAYTLSSFLSALNGRPDEYGRSLENRMRIAGEVLDRVRADAGADFPVGVRFDGEECIKDGYTVQDAREIALRLAEHGAAWISISVGGKFEDAIHKPGVPLYPYTGYSGDRCMPGASYPDGANVHIAEGIRAFLRGRGQTAPVVATGKIRTPELAESLLAADRVDLIGMARALLADPDWVRKLAAGRADRIVRCVYGNICKNLDENFRTVVCVLWPQGEIQAPDSDDPVPPDWPAGSVLSAEDRGGRVRLSWSAARDNEGVYGYEILRSESGADWVHLTSVRALGYTDRGVVGGRAYRYRVRAYDRAGNRSPSLEAACG